MKRASWIVLAVVVSFALWAGAGDEEAASTPGVRADRIAKEVRCPTCRNLSAAESDAKAAEAVRTEIRRRIDAGQSDDQIRAYLVSRYGKDILLRPEGRGLSALVWALPVALLVLGAGGLLLVYQRRRRLPQLAATAEDRVLVEEVLKT